MWSRIKNTELELKAYILTNENAINGCEYHNNNHIEDMYKYLHDTDEPYDEALDWAVLFHDIVYDAEPEKEARSGRTFVKMIEKFRGCNLRLSDQARVHSLIMRTVDHKVLLKIKGSSAIIRADLHALANKAEAVRNFAKIMNESMSLYDCNIEEFAESNIKFMTGLRERVASNILVDKEHEMFYNEVLVGIDITIQLAKAIKDVK